MVQLKIFRCGCLPTVGLGSDDAGRSKFSSQICNIVTSVACRDSQQIALLNITGIGVACDVPHGACVADCLPVAAASASADTRTGTRRI